MLFPEYSPDPLMIGTEDRPVFFHSPLFFEIRVRNFRNNTK